MTDEELTAAAPRERTCTLLYPGLFADEAYRRHPQQIDRVTAVLVEQAAEAARLRERLRETEAELRELASAALRSGKH